MPKAGEMTYFSAIGEGGQQHSLNKPFSDPGCSDMLVSIGVIFRLLPPPPARILDLGCGTGWTSQFFARRGYRVTGQDISSEALALARDFSTQLGIGDTLDFHDGDYESLPFDKEFDVAIFYDSLHHAEDEGAAVASAYRALKPGGMLITHEPGEGHATAPASLRAMEEFGVTEKDMPPRRIIEVGLAAGFSAYKIFPLPPQMANAIYHTRHLKSEMKWRNTGFFAGVHRAWRLLRNKGVRRMTYPSERESGLVMLVK